MRTASYRFDHGREDVSASRRLTRRPGILFERSFWTRAAVGVVSFGQNGSLAWLNSDSLTVRPTENSTHSNMVVVAVIDLQTVHTGTPSSPEQSKQLVLRSARDTIIE
jgi:hypothetical protein